MMTAAAVVVLALALAAAPQQDKDSTPARKRVSRRVTLSSSRKTDRSSSGCG